MLKEQQQIPLWWPLKEGIYDIHKSYADNMSHGPVFDGVVPERTWPSRDRWIDFLGVSVASRVGVPAGPLLDSHWTTLAADLGFDIVTYKTIRSSAYPGHGLPNVVFVDARGDLTPDRFGETLQSTATPPHDMTSLAITNSFGMPSQTPHYLTADIQKAQNAMRPGQALVVSVVGTPGPNVDFIQDFVAAARLAKECGATIIEANFSCPNVTTGEGCTYQSAKAVQETSRALLNALGSIPLIIKMGMIPNLTLLREVLNGAARAGVRAISGINTVKMKVVDEAGKAALGPGRLESGVCGGPIRAVALEFIREARKIIDMDKLDLTLIGVGGITLPEHIDQFLEAGADFTQSATGMMWDPYLALRYHQMKEQSYE